MRRLDEDRTPYAAMSLERQETWAVPSTQTLNLCIRLENQPFWGLFFFW